MGETSVTTEEYVLIRSTLPKDGTHTLLEHMMAMGISISGECVVVKPVKVVPSMLQVSEKRVTFEVKPSIIKFNIDPQKSDYGIVTDVVDVKVKA